MISARPPASLLVGFERFLLEEETPINSDSRREAGGRVFYSAPERAATNTKADGISVGHRNKFGHLKPRLAMTRLNLSAPFNRSRLPLITISLSLKKSLEAL
jgi:hypothetical protein